MNESLRRLRTAIKELRLEVGDPSGRELARKSGGKISHTTVCAVLRCDVLPSWRNLKEVVRLLGGRIEPYKELWVAAQRAALPDHPLSTTEAEVEPSWNVFDMAAVRDQLISKPHVLMRRLTELRFAIEPTASFLAAEHLSEAEADRLTDLACQLQDLGRNELFGSDSALGAAHREKYRAVDVEFHGSLLRGCRNEFIGGLIGHVTAALDYRIEHDRVGTGGNKPFPAVPMSIALWLHRGLAVSVQQRRCSAAEAFSRAILAEIREGPLPESVAQALRAAVACLDPRLMGPGGTDWPDFESEIDELLTNEVWPGR